MTGKTSPARYKLIKTFFWIARETGMGEENARAVVSRLYKTESLKDLTTDELKRVVDELAAVTGVELRKPPPKPSRRKAPAEDMVVTRAGKVISLPTREQLAKIDYLSDRMRMSHETLQVLIRKAGGDPALTVMSARTLIEMLKAMHDRGWKDTTAEKTAPPAGRSN